MAGLRRDTRTGWILDLRDPDESMPVKADFGHELHQNQDLRTDDSYLVVLASTALWSGSATARACSPRGLRRRLADAVHCVPEVRRRNGPRGVDRAVQAEDRKSTPWAGPPMGSGARLKLFGVSGEERAALPLQTTMPRLRKSRGPSGTLCQDGWKSWRDGMAQLTAPATTATTSCWLPSMTESQSTQSTLGSPRWPKRWARRAHKLNPSQASRVQADRAHPDDQGGAPPRRVAAIPRPGFLRSRGAVLLARPSAPHRGLHQVDGPAVS